MDIWFRPPHGRPLSFQFYWYVALVAQQADKVNKAEPADKWIEEYGLNCASLLFDEFCDRHGIDAETFSPETFCELPQLVPLPMWTMPV